MVAYFVPSDVHKDRLRIDPFLINRILVGTAILPFEEVVVFSAEDFVVLLQQLLLARLGEVVERFPLLFVQEEARRVQIHLDFLDAEHFGYGLVVENHLVLASPLEVTDF